MPQNGSLHPVATAANHATADAFNLSPRSRAAIVDGLRHAIVDGFRQGPGRVIGGIWRRFGGVVSYTRRDVS